MEYNITKCRAKYYKNKKANFTFYIVDYDFPADWECYKHIIDMRNANVVKTRYFHTGKEMRKFLDKI